MKLNFKFLSTTLQNKKIKLSLHSYQKNVILHSLLSPGNCFARRNTASFRLDACLFLSIRSCILCKYNNRRIPFSGNWLTSTDSRFNNYSGLYSVDIFGNDTSQWRWKSFASPVKWYAAYAEFVLETCV